MKLPKFLRLPTPKELGYSSALPMRAFGAKIEKYTWEDYHQEMKAQFPIKYFFNRTLSHLYAVYVSNKLKNIKYWIVSHTIRKYHLLDMRSPKNEYKYGYVDCDFQFLYASMAILNNFIKEQDTANRIVWLEREKKSEDIGNFGNYNYQNEIDFCKEILLIQKWWEIDRPKSLDVYFTNYIEQYIWDEKCREKDNQMMIRLIELRNKMWT